MIHKDYNGWMKNKLCVSYQSDNMRVQAEKFAQKYALECLSFNDASAELTLNYTDKWVELRNKSLNIAIHVDFVSGSLAHRQQYGGGRGQAIAKAIGLKQGTQPPTVIDATAGLGKDSFVMACLGCSVTLIERSEIISQLVVDAIQRGENDADFNIFIQRGFKLIHSQAEKYLNALPENNRPEIIYLDPMYPERKKSALVKKNMQLLQSLLGNDDGTETLINCALKIAQKRVVVKRPKGAEVIGNHKPTMSIESKKTRYDVYVISSTTN